MRGSELDLQTELQLSGVQRIGDLREGGIVHGLNGRAEVRMIECIEELRAPLQRQAFANAAEVNCPADDKIKVLERRPRDVVTAGIAERSERLLLNRTLVEPLFHGARAPVDVSHD